MNTESRIAIVIDTNGQASIGEFDAVTGSVKRLSNAADVLSSKGKELSKPVEDAGKKWEKFGTVAGAAIGSILGGLATVVLATINAADETSKMAEKLGVSTVFLSEMGFAAKASGSDVQGLEKHLNQLSVVATAAANGGKAQGRLFDALGVSAVDASGKVQSLEQLLPQIADKFAGMADGPQKAALAVKLFGESGRDMVPLLNKGAKGIEELRAKAAELGITLDDETARSAAEFKDQMGELTSISQGFFLSLAKDLLPVLKVLGGLLVDQAEGSSKAASGTGVLTGAIQILSSVVVIAKGIWEAFLNVVFGVFDVVTTTVKSTLSTIGGVISAAYAMWTKLLTGDLKGAMEAGRSAIAENTARLQQSGREIAGAYGAAKTGVVDAMTGVGESVGAIWNPAMAAAGDAAAASGDKVIKWGEDADGAADKAAKAARDLRDLEKALDGINGVLRDQAIDAGGEAVAAAFDYLEVLERLIAAEEELVRLNKLDAETMRALQLAREGASKSYDKALQQIADKQAKLNRDAVRPSEDALRYAREELSLMGLSGIEREKEIDRLQDAETIERLKLQLAEDKLSIDEASYAQAKKNIELLEVELKKRRELNEIQRLRDGGLSGLLGGALDGMFEEGGKSFFDGFKDGLDKILGPTGKDGSYTSKDIEGIANFVGDSAGLLGYAADQFREWKDAPLNAVVNIAAKIPGVVGAIAQAIQGINSLFGGKLLGTKYEREKSFRDIRLTQDGFNGSITTQDVKEGAFFSGKKRRRNTTALDPESQAQLDAIFEALRLTVTTAARELGAGLPQAVVGAFKEEYDKDGKLVSSISTVLGQTYRETAQEFTQRLQAENLLAVLKQFLPATELEAIASNWRENAGALQDGATLLFAISTDMKNATQLWTATGSGVLARIVGVAEALQQPGETLVQTYQRLTQTARTYGNVVAQAEGELLLAGVSDFAKSIIQIRQEELARTKSLRDQARALGNLSAREEDLARVRVAAQAKIDAAARELELNLLDQVAELYGTPLDQIQAQIDAITGASNSAAGSLRAFLDSLLLSDELSPLTDAERLNAARGQLTNATNARDVDGFIEAAQAFLGISRQLNASGGDYRGDFDAVQALAAQFGFGGANGGSLADLIAERDALQARQRTAERLSQAQELAQGIADLADVRGLGFDAVAEGLGVDMAALAADLGLGGDQVSAYLESLQVDTADLAQLLFDLPERFAQAFFDVLYNANLTLGETTVSLPPTSGGPVVPPAGSGSSAPGAGDDLVGSNAIINALLQQIANNTAATASSNIAMQQQDELAALNAEFYGSV